MHIERFHIRVVVSYIVFGICHAQHDIPKKSDLALCLQRLERQKKSLEAVPGSLQKQRQYEKKIISLKIQLGIPISPFSLAPLSSKEKSCAIVERGDENRRKTQQISTQSASSKTGLVIDGGDTLDAQQRSHVSSSQAIKGSQDITISSVPVSLQNTSPQIHPIWSEHAHTDPSKIGWSVPPPIMGQSFFVPHGYEGHHKRGESRHSKTMYQEQFSLNPHRLVTLWKRG